MRSLVCVFASVIVACGGAEASGDAEDAASDDTSIVDSHDFVDAGVDTFAADSACGLGSECPHDTSRDDVELERVGQDDSALEIEAPPSCEAGATMCSGACVDLARDPTNCGGCGNACITHVCCGGTCGGECPAGDVVCGDPCACVNLATDSNNCGACGKKCCAGEACASGVCVVGCGAGMTACTDPTTGCGTCVDTRTDPTNCGACGHACVPGHICVGGSCS